MVIVVGVVGDTGNGEPECGIGGFTSTEVVSSCLQQSFLVSMGGGGGKVIIIGWGVCVTKTDEIARLKKDGLGGGGEGLIQAIYK